MSCAHRSVRAEADDATPAGIGHALQAGVNAALFFILVAGQPPSLELEQLLREVDAANPTIQAAQHRVRAAHLAITSARMPAEPTVGVIVDDVPTDPRMWMAPRAALAEPRLMGQAGWMVPITGMPQLRGRMARAMEDMARADASIVRIALRRAARIAFWELWLTERAQEINADAQRTLAGIEEMALAQYASGRAVHHGVLRVQSEREAIKTEAIQLQQQRTALVALINALRATPDAPVGLARAAHSPREDARVPALYARAVAARPELAMAHAQQDAARIDASMARRSLIPDPMVMLMAGGQPGAIPQGHGSVPLPMSPMVGVGVSIPLPIFGPWRQWKDAEAAESRARAAEADARAAEQRIGAELQTVLSRIQTLEQREDLIVTSLWPRANEALEAAQAALGSGQATALEVLESRRQLQNTELELANTRAEREAALAELDAVLGIGGENSPEVRP